MAKKIVAGNWKMNKTLDEAKMLASEVFGMVQNELNNDTEVILCAPFPYLLPVKNLLGGSSIFVGAQNCSQHASGAYTGEVSAMMLKSMGITHVIIGHSERRQYFQETNEVVAAKVNAALQHHVTPIFCCGEPLDVREQGGHEQLVREQLAQGLFHLTAEQIRQIIIAYEPVWAIGTGRTATAEQAQEMHAFIRRVLSAKYGDTTAEISILYGGSVNAANARELFSAKDVDGGLVGGASLKSREFVDIIKSA